MRSPGVWRVGLLAVLLAWGCAWAEDAADAEKLAADLGSADFDTRTAAEEKLSLLGDTARPAIEKAAASKDFEVREAATRLLKRMSLATAVFMAFDSDGKPAAGVTAELTVSNQAQGFGRGEQPKPQTVAFDDKGELHLPGLAPGPTNFNFVFKTWCSTSNGYILNLHSGSNPQIMTMMRGASISGQILNEAGEPLKDARVVVGLTNFDADELAQEANLRSRNPFALHDGADGMSAQTNDEGKFTIEQLPAGIYSWYASAEGMLPLPGKPVRLHEGEKAQLQPLKLHAAKTGKWKAILSDTEGKPLKKHSLLASVTQVFDGPDADKRRATMVRLREYNMNGQPGITVETDEDGKLSMELPEGRYRMLILPNPDVDQNEEMQLHTIEYAVDSASIVAGQDPEAVAIKPVVSGTISGTIQEAVAEDGGSIQVISEEEYKEQLLQNLTLSSNFSGVAGVKSAQCDADGAYTLENVRPGKVVLMLHDSANRAALIFGVEVKAGETVKAPDFKFANLESKGKGFAGEVTGYVSGTDHKPVPNAAIALLYSGGSWSTSLNNEGSFEYKPGIEEHIDISTAKLQVRAAGYKTQTVPLVEAAPGHVVVSVVLEKNTYGELKVRVVDEESHPIAGATVSSHYSGPDRNVPIEGIRDLQTNQSGEVTFKRLCSGTRVIGVRHEGFFLEAPPKVEIKAGAVEVVTVKMNTGMTAKGRIELPAGWQGPVQVELSKRGQMPYSVLMQNGEYTFPGLAVDDYIINPTAIGLLPAAETKFNVKAGQKSIAAPSIRMERSCSVALSAPWMSSGSLYFVPLSEWKNAFDANFEWSSSVSGFADADGRVEASGLLPGDYVALYTDNDAPDNTLVLQPMVDLGVVHAEAIAARDIATLKPVALPAPSKDAGGITFRVKVEHQEETARGEWFLSHSLFIQGEKAHVSSTFGENEGNIQVVGDPPPALRPTDMNRYNVKRLPAGEYKVYVRSCWINYSREYKFPKAELMKTVIVKAGEILDLGEISFRNPNMPPMMAAADPEVDFDVDETTPGFQP